MEDSQEEALATEEELDEKYNEVVAEEGPSEADLTVRFIGDYVRDNSVTAGYRFTAVRQQVPMRCVGEFEHRTHR